MFKFSINNLKKEKGFTLVELLAVIVILAILALLLVPVIFNVIEKSRKNTFLQNITALKTQAELEHVKNGTTEFETGDLQIKNDNFEYDVRIVDNEFRVYYFAHKDGKGDWMVDIEECNTNDYCSFEKIIGDSKYVVAREGNIPSGCEPTPCPCAPYEFFSYTGATYKYEDENYYYVKLITSGTFTVKEARTIDIFLVGGGGGGAISGGGGGGGYTLTQKNITLNVSDTTSAVIGAGGARMSYSVTGTRGSNGTATSFMQYSADGGKGGGIITEGLGHGGSGGGSCNPGMWGSGGGSDGADGLPDPQSSMGGTNGQGTTTRAFGEPDGELFAGGGGSANSYGPSAYGGEGGGGDGGYYYATTPDEKKSGLPNTGGGGGGSHNGHSGAGGSGVIILRWPK